MELRVKPVSFPEIIEFNFDELKAEIEERTSVYASLAYTDEQIGEAKTDRAMLNRFSKALNDERIRVKKTCMKPYDDFEKRVKELDTMIGVAVSNIDAQVKGFEEREKAEKMERIKEIWSLKDKPEWLSLERFFEKKWLNKTTTISSIENQISDIIEKIYMDLDVIRNLPDYRFEATEEYKRTLNLQGAIMEGQRQAEIQKKKAEEEARKAAERERRRRELEEAERQASMAQMAAAAVQNFEQQPFERAKTMNQLVPPEQPEKEWRAFRAYMSASDSAALRQFFFQRHIRFEEARG